MEIIVSNDGSTDSTLSIVSQLVKMDDRTIILDHENVGAGSARNLAIEQAHGKVIIFLDCDDLILEGLYSQGCKEFLQRAIDNDIEVIATARLLTDESAQTEELLTTPHNNEIFQERRLTETVETEDLYDDSKINEGFYPRVKESDLINPPAPDAQLVWPFRNGEHKRAPSDWIVSYSMYGGAGSWQSWSRQEKSNGETEEAWLYWGIEKKETVTVYKWR